MKRNTGFTIHCLEQLFRYTALAYEVLTDITIDARKQNPRITWTSSDMYDAACKTDPRWAEPTSHRFMYRALIGRDEK